MACQCCHIEMVTRRRGVDSKHPIPQESGISEGDILAAANEWQTTLDVSRYTVPDSARHRLLQANGVHR